MRADMAEGGSVWFVERTRAVPMRHVDWTGTDPSRIDLSGVGSLDLSSREGGTGVT